MSLDLNSTWNIWEVCPMHGCVLRECGGHRKPAFLLQFYIMSPVCYCCQEFSIHYIDSGLCQQCIHIMKINTSVSWCVFHTLSIFRRNYQICHCTYHKPQDSFVPYCCFDPIEECL
jgi:hypothetical protein